MKTPHNNNESDLPDIEDQQKPANEGRRSFIIKALGAGALLVSPLIKACAGTPNRPEMDETTKAVMEILKEHGFEYIGTQTDRSVIKYAVSNDMDLAKSAAEEEIRSALGGGNVSFGKPWYKRTPRGWVAVVQGRKGKSDKMKKTHKLPKMSPETKKKMIEHDQKVVHHLNKKLKEYKRKYGKRKEFPAFASKVQEQIAEYKNTIKGLQEGRIDRGYFTITGSRDEMAESSAGSIISMCDRKAGLLSVMERMDEMRSKSDKKMGRLK